MYTWWGVYGDKENLKLKIFIIREDGKLIGIAPLFVSRTKSLSVQIRKLQFLGSFGVGSDYLDFILYPGKEGEILKRLFEHLKENDDEWDAFEIYDIPDDSSTLFFLKSIKGFHKLDGKPTVCPVLKLSKTYEKTYRDFKKNLRSDISRKKKKFISTGGKFVEVRDREKLDEAFEIFLSLNKDRTAIKRITSPFLDSEFSRFHKNLSGILFAKGFIRLFFLTMNDRPMAGLYVFKYDDRYFYYQSGFNSYWNKLSPGLLIFDRAIENAIDEGAREFDFLRGDEEYKFRWTRDTRCNLKITFFRKTLKNKIIFSILKTGSALRAAKKMIASIPPLPDVLANPAHRQKTTCPDANFK
ncbi:MAG: GNAT family N-acetyltransferase [Deltaproteobacteria bacterium]|nr:GNAT family N-acetyltransferase [Deltaproteobacteria bacterium]